MSTKTWITIGLIVGTTIGSYIPALWGGDVFLSFSSIFLTLIGGIIGVWAGFKIGKNLE